MVEPITTYEQFWLFYLAEHRNPRCRALHLVGTAIVIGAAVAALALRDARLLAICPFAGYGFAWVGHFGFEHNRPATFRYPLWSLRADFRMFRVALTGRLSAELARAAEAYPA